MNHHQSSAASFNLWSITSGQRRRYLGAIAATALGSLCFFAAPLIGKYAIDLVLEADLAEGMPGLRDWAFQAGADFDSNASRYLWFSALATLCVTALGGVFLYLRGRFAALASESIVRRLRDRLYNHLHHLPANFHDSADTGDLVQRCSSDVETLRVFLSSDVVEIGRAIILVLTVLPILFWLNPDLALVSLVLVPVLVIGAYVFFRKVRDRFQQTDEAEGAMTAVLQENLTGIRVVRAFARQDFETGKFAERNRVFRDHNHKLIQLMGLYWSVSDFFCMTQIGLVLMVGAAMVMDGSMSVGTLFAFWTYEGMIIWPVRQLGRVLTDSGKAVVSLGRINEIVGEEEESPGVAPASGRADGALRIRDLNFSFRPGQPVLDNINLDIAAGETVAFVGPPGCGKSTLINLLLRLYDYRQGSITLDGQELLTLDRKYVRSQVAVVMQEPFLYSGSIEGNLRVGRRDANRNHMEAAARDAAVHDTIMAFPEGYNAMVGERGVTLSGGQRQRLALARALIKDPPILVLDDALSAVDTGTERHILDALERRQGRHTTIVIAHRLSSVVGADRIVVLDEGRIAQVGSHEQLLNEAGPYRRLVEIQGNLETTIREELVG